MDVMRATSCSLCDPSPCDLRIRSAWVDEAHLASMWSTWAPMDKLDCSTTPNTRKVLTCSAPCTTGPSGLMLDLCRLLVTRLCSKCSCDLLELCRITVFAKCESWIC